MVKTAEERAQERQAQKQALRAAMLAGRRQQQQQQQQHNSPTHEELEPAAVPPPPPADPLPLTPTSKARFDQQQQQQRDAHERPPSPPDMPLPQLPASSPPARPSSVSKSMSEPRSRASSSSSASSEDFISWAANNSHSVVSHTVHAGDDAPGSPASSVLDLDESIDVAAERSGILSEPEEGQEESDPGHHSRSKHGAASASTFDLLGSLTNKNTPQMQGYSSSDEEDFDLSLDSSSVGTRGIPSLAPGSSSAASRLSTVSSVSSAGSSSNTPREERFPSPKMPFSYKSGLLSPPATAPTRRSWAAAGNRPSRTSSSSSDRRYSSMSAPDEAGSRIATPSTTSTQKNAPASSHKLRSAIQQPRVVSSPARQTQPTQPRGHTRNHSVASTASNDSADVGFNLERAASPPSALFPMPPSSPPLPPSASSTATSTSRRLSKLPSIASVASTSSSPKTSPAMSEFGALPRRPASAASTSSRRSLRPPGSAGKSSLPPPSTATPSSAKTTSSLPGMYKRPSMLSMSGSSRSRASALPLPQPRH